MKPHFFLILSASGGAGHLRAAEALEQTAPHCRVPIRVENYDCLDFTPTIFKKVYSQSYLSLVNNAPELWGYLYQKSEQRPYTKKGLLKLFDRFNYKKYIRALRSLNPDAIICTHFLPFISISNEAAAGLNFPFFAATTDFDVHQYWVNDLVRRYYVYHEESAWQLESKGVPREKISVKGIPLHPEFLNRPGKPRARREVGLDPDLFTVLVLSGGFGIGKIRDIVKYVATTLGRSSPQRFNLLVVCGNNEKARASLNRIAFPQNVRPQIHGFVNNVHVMMEAADVLVSKAGGLTSAEAMAKRLPMLIVDPIPGQEMRNADFIVEAGAGWKAINLPNLSYKLRKLIEHPEILTDMRRATQSLAKPKAAEDILTDVYNYLKETNGGAP